MLIVITILIAVIVGLIVYIIMRPTVVQQPVYIVRDEPRVHWNRPRWGERRF